jgi:hypothetical protein
VPPAGAWQDVIAKAQIAQDEELRAAAALRGVGDAVKGTQGPKDLIAPSLRVQAASPLVHRVFEEIISDPWVQGKMEKLEDGIREAEIAVELQRRKRELQDEHSHLRRVLKTAEMLQPYLQHLPPQERAGFSGHVTQMAQQLLAKERALLARSVELDDSSASYS